MNNNDIRNAINEISDDELDMVAGGCSGHQNQNGKGHQQHGKGYGKGHDGCGSCDDGTATMELEDGADTYAAPAGTTVTCPFCGSSATVADPASWMQNHLASCPKKPAC